MGTTHIRHVLVLEYKGSDVIYESVSEIIEELKVFWVWRSGLAL